MSSASAVLALPPSGPLQASNPTPPRMNRRLYIVIAVLGFHVLGLWALQAGLLRRAAELVVPVEVLAERIQLPQPQVAPAPPQPPVHPAPAPRQPASPRPALAPAPQTVAIPDPAPATPATNGITASQPPPLPVQAAVATAEPTKAPPAPLTPAQVDLPSNSADYLNNPPPAYPPMSKRLNEQGKVIVRAFIEVDGTASKAEIRSSSGYDRLDQTALQTVLKWRYVPGKRAGVPEPMWFNIPISFVLE